MENFGRKWSNLESFLSTTGPFSNSQYEANSQNFMFMRDYIKILVIGAGGLGCELLKDLGMMGFKHIHVIDMDTVELSNLNRQFLFRKKDIGKPKAEVAANFVNNRIKGCCVIPHFCKIQDFESNFYRGFNLVVCGLDSVVARRWINGMLLSLVSYNNDGEIDVTSIIPMVDGGTEGFKGNARVILPGKTACIECNLDLFPQQINYPMCTIAETPRLPEHCIEYVRTLLWGNEKPFGDVCVDGDDTSHIQWIYEKASIRARQYGIHGVSFRLTQGVVKHIIPAVASTNAVIAAICATEVLKLITFCYDHINNYINFNDGQGVYTYTFEAEKKDDCSACSHKPIPLSVDINTNLQNMITLLKQHPRFQLLSPSITSWVEGKNKTLYISNIESLEQATRQNLSKTLLELGITYGSELQVTDITSPKVILITISV
uniref:NEDD8-activating enzyme E1 catalytic subunit n=1 Tax=Hydra vulgaris TaxID=6087 RepID=T2M8Z7_HYDVU